MRRTWLVLVVLGCSAEPAVVAPGGDTPVDTVLDEPTDSVRGIGPNAEEYGLITAWEILEETEVLETGEGCDTSTEAYDELVESPYVLGAVNHAFFRVENESSAVNHSCANGYPAGCEPTDLVFGIDGNVLVAETETRGAVAEFPGCENIATTVFTLEDNGDTGTLTQDVSRSYTSLCPPEEKVLDGCVVTFRYELSFTDAR